MTAPDLAAVYRSLREDPEAREELRRLVLTDELLALPAVVARLAQRVDQLAERMDQLAERMDQLTAAQQRTEQRLEALIDQVRSIDGRVGWLEGAVLEDRVTRRASSYFQRIARRIRVLDSPELDDILEEAVERGVLTDEEAVEVRLADTVVRARREGADVYLVVETSRTVDLGDVERARDRARLLERTGTAALPVVAGRFIGPAAEEGAELMRVWRVIDGRTLPPPSDVAA